ncbi:uncharacterized protein B0T23DRAFT_347149 [Neurospora hispaniola]|uniref:Ecp2 effector protein domain-containing protein n=1 Tax=Neurospora hispaniola TaxID=588809 RepID=A0AAJ0HYK1_9PEZI|nr:hypothetical protein B0T23DRAFT_347149 [Neurospora hispaniola]
MQLSTIPSLFLGLIAFSAPLALASPTPINSNGNGNANLPFNLINKHHKTVVTTSRRQTGSSTVDTTPTCVSDPEGFMTMFDARSCLDEIAAKGSEQMTVPAPGRALCERSSGKFWAGVSMRGTQVADASDIAAAGKLILDACKFDGVVGMQTEMTGGGAYVATNGNIYVMFSKDEEDD